MTGYLFKTPETNIFVIAENIDKAIGQTEKRFEKWELISHSSCGVIGLKPKPLNWIGNQADTDFGSYRIVKRRFIFDGLGKRTMGDPHKSEPEARAEAQEHFNRLVMKQIESKSE